MCMFSGKKARERRAVDGAEEHNGRSKIIVLANRDGIQSTISGKHVYIFHWRESIYSVIVKLFHLKAL